MKKHLLLPASILGAILALLLMLSLGERQDWWSRAETDAEGSFSYADLQMGKFKIRVFDVHDVLEKTVVLTAETPRATFEFVCPDRGTIQGELTDDRV